MSDPVRYRVAILDKMPGKHFDNPDIERDILNVHADVSISRSRTAQEIVPQIADADALIIWSRFAMSAEVLAQLPRCRAIVCASVGYEHIDLAYAAQRGITVCNVPDYGTDEVADHAMAMILALVRKLRILDADVRAGVWDWKRAGAIVRLQGATIGIVGFGRIGMAVARRAQAFGMDVVFFDPHVPSGVEKSLGVRRHEQLSPLLRESQIVSLHALANEDTAGMIGRAELSCLSPECILINTARGVLIDQQALVEALESGAIGGLGLDVLSAEPNVPAALASSQRVILTPHAAWYSTASFMENRRKSAAIARDLLLDRPVRDVVNRTQMAGTTT